MKTSSMKVPLLLVLAVTMLTLIVGPAFGSGARNASALQTMQEFAAGRQGVVCWISRRNGGAVRIWACDFDGANLRQVSPNDNGYEHVGPLIRPDGTGIIYLRTPTFINTSKHSNPGSFYDDFVGDMVLVDADDADGSSARTLVSGCRSIFEWRVAAWMSNDEFAYIGRDHNTYVYTISTGQSRKVFNDGSPEDGYGALPNPQLSYCIDGMNRLYRIHNPGPSGTCEFLYDYNGCQGSLSRDGTIAFRTEAEKPRSLVAMPLNDIPSEWDMIPPDRFPPDQNYLYFPRLSWSQEFAACGASDSSHSHWEADYDVFVIPVDPDSKRPTGDAVKYSFGTTSAGVCLDAWPDAWVATGPVEPRLGSITITPNTASVAPGETAEFTATVKDQFGSPFAASVTWSVNGGGAMESAPSLPNATSHTAVFRSDGAVGVFTVRAESGDLWATASATVVDPTVLHLRINCGTSSPAVAGWEAGSNYVSGGADYDFSGPADVGGVANAAPAAVYTTVRHQDHEYSFTSVPNGDYTVRIHFYDEETGGGRAMDYTIEGVKVLDDFSIVDEAGGAGRALVRDFAVTVADGNGLQIVAEKDGGNDAFEAGIEVFAAGVAPSEGLTLLSPAGGDAYAVGETLTVSWRTNGDCCENVDIYLELDGEGYLLNSTGNILTGPDSSGVFAWVVGALRGGASPVSAEAVVRVEDYFQPSINDQSMPFAITGGAAVVPRDIARGISGGVTARAGADGALELSVLTPGRYSVRVVSLRGETIAAFAGNGVGTYHLGSHRLPHGMFLVRVRHADGTVWTSPVQVLAP